MVDVISTVSVVQSSSLKQGVQTEAAQSSAPASEAAAPPSSSQDFVSSAIYVDNLQNVAILEYRSSSTGEVVQQYPTQSQIDAFKRAEHLSEHPVKQPEASAPAAAVVTQAAPAAPAPSAPAPSAPSAPSGGDKGSGGTTTSVLA